MIPCTVQRHLKIGGGCEIAVCGIDFAIGVTDKEVSKAEKYVHFNGRIHSFLIRKEKENCSELNLLLNLDPNKQTVLYTKDINDLLDICEQVLSNKINGVIGDEIRNFAQELKALCKEAIEHKKHIYAIGD